MKKPIFILILIVAIFSLSMAGLIGCGTSNEISKYHKKLQKADSVTVEIEINVPFFGKTKITMKNDGNKTYTSGLVLLGQPEEYTQTSGNTRYVYRKSLTGVWTKTVADADDDNFAAVEYYEKFFNASDYVYSEDKGGYVLKENIRYQVMESLEATELVLSFSGDICNVTGKVDYNGNMMPFTLVVKDLNNSQISLPI